MLIIRAPPEDVGRAPPTTYFGFPLLKAMRKSDLRLLGPGWGFRSHPLIWGWLEGWLGTGGLNAPDLLIQRQKILFDAVEPANIADEMFCGIIPGQFGQGDA